MNREICLSTESQEYAKIIFEIIKTFNSDQSWKSLFENDEEFQKLRVDNYPGYIQFSLGSNSLRLDKRENISQDENEFKRLIRLGVFRILADFYEDKSPWGILTGIRPSKIAHRLFEAGFNREDTIKYLINNYELREDKAKLLTEVTENEKKFLAGKAQPNGISIYINIPFCPSKCSYCSFPSVPITRKISLQRYFSTLINEIQETAKIIKKFDLRVQTVYVGGGTPTILDEEQLFLLQKMINDKFLSEETLEYTFEAGRPDTINQKKLEILKAGGVTRISINPQTLFQDTLDLIGRKHSVGDVRRAYDQAVKAGFNNINMDFIIGLPGEDKKIVENNLQLLSTYSPESITLHTLAKKRTADLEKGVVCNLKNDIVQEMMSLYQNYCNNIGYRAYYLYRQKQSAGNLENVGYAISKPCLYNIFMIEERQTILGLGAGASSKIVNQKDFSLENIFNPKDILIYEERMQEKMSVKAELIKKWITSFGNS